MPPRRRAAALGVLLISTGALLATSPPIIESRIQESTTAQVELTHAAPRATGILRLELSADVLAAPDASRSVRIDGEVRVGDHPAPPDVDVTVRPLGVDVMVDEGRSRWPVDELCRVSERCERDFEIVAEWAASQPAEQRTVSVSASVEIVYDGVDEPPPKAAASWSMAEPFVAEPAGNALVAETQRQQVVLDSDRPFAIREVTLSSTAAARLGRLVAFVDHRVTQAAREAVAATIIADGVSHGDPFDPFDGCRGEGRCDRSITVVLEFLGADHELSADTEWSLLVVGTYDGEPPPGAELTAVVRGGIDIGPDTTATFASLSGTLEVPRTEFGDPPATLRIALSANEAALRPATPDLAHPLAVGRLRLEADAEAAVELGGARPANQGQRVGTRKLRADQPLTILSHPLAACTAGDTACESEMSLEIGGLRRDGASTRIDWSLDVLVYHPGQPEPPPGAEVLLEVLDGGG